MSGTSDLGSRTSDLGPAAATGRGAFSDHVPSSLIYGPVSSRRFGRSLGVSVSWPGAVGCQWRCPYCQLAGMPYRDDLIAPADTIVAATLAALAQAPAGNIDVVTFAGSGEPLDHPEFPAIAARIAPAARVRGIATALLTNGDGIERADVREAFAQWIDRPYVKWDPGPRAGAWRALDPAAAAARRAALASLPALRIQALLYRQGACGGNAGDAQCAQWLADLAGLRPVEVHLTTVEREPGRMTVEPVDAATLERWRAATAAALGVPTLAFPSRVEG